MGGNVMDIESEIKEIMAFNTIQDMCRKKNFDAVQKAKLLRWYMQEHQLSLRQVEVELGIPKTTAHDILGYNDLGKERMQELLDDGYTKTDIRRAISSGKIGMIAKYNEFDETLRKALNNLKPFQQW